ncbi:MAG: tRNA (guanosine(37)-N1)-methyltransferase TrmD [Chloroflexi bacterium]|nr:tRNA (guanosine(37)-N1)-methyltransferase TrmD [Chloroflexota bacterium]MBP8056692.1 tRNA (guanosine(37)-N1)-methyltransferase TrmD [Chloroflexota bacterium]
MRIDILTLFPEMFSAYLNESILKRAQDSGRVSIHLHNIRDYTTDKHHITDLPPFGGGGGMILKAEPIFAAAEAVSSQQSAVSSDQLPVTSDQSPIYHSPFTIHHSPFTPGQSLSTQHSALSPQSSVLSPIILLTPQGRTFSQKIAAELAQQERIMLICGRYEGVDERVRQHLVTDEISIGDFVLTGGELAAMVVVDAVTRLLPGVLGAEGAAASDSHATGLLEGPHYTRPETFRSWAVPDVLRSGHQGHIDRWRRQQALRRTWQRRPDMLLTAPLTEADKQYLAQLAREYVDNDED